MSIEGFVMHGDARRLIGQKDGGVYGPIQLYDIGEENYLGAKYTDGSCQAHPLVWYPRDVQLALQQSQHKRVHLPEPAAPVSARPKLTSTGRPRLGGSER